MPTSHLQYPMNAQAYIQSRLDNLRTPLGLPRPATNEELIEAIFKIIMSKKHRKYSVTSEYATHIRNAIRENVTNSRPINVTFLGGCYKLWRLKEAPESDWAELFAYIYYTQWIRPICEIYAPGVWFDFFLDDLIVPRINNISGQDVDTYRESRQRLIDFLRPYQPPNLNMTLTGIGEQFPSRSAYETSLANNIDKLSKELPGGLPKLSDAQRTTISLNVKTIEEQEHDPLWRERVELIHSAYMLTKGATGYSTASPKIRAFTQPFPNGTCIAVGSTRASIAKFWAGVGALKPAGDNDFNQVILPPSQLAAAKFDWQDVHIPGLDGKNFTKIRVIA